MYKSYCHVHVHVYYVLYMILNMLICKYSVHTYTCTHVHVENLCTHELVDFCKLTCIYTHIALYMCILVCLRLHAHMCSHVHTYRVMYLNLQAHLPDVKDVCCRDRRCVNIITGLM